VISGLPSLIFKLCWLLCHLWWATQQLQWFQLTSSVARSLCDSCLAELRVSNSCDDYKCESIVQQDSYQISTWLQTCYIAMSRIYAIRLPYVRPSVCLSVCTVGWLWWHGATKSRNGHMTAWIGVLATRVRCWPGSYSILWSRVLPRKTSGMWKMWRFAFRWHVALS